MRQLKHHERKLLKKVDFLRWKNEHNMRELQVRRGRQRRAWRAALACASLDAHAAGAAPLLFAPPLPRLHTPEGGAWHVFC
jgi:hypothetical protein